VDEALGRAEESIRLNPRRVMLPRTAFSLRRVLETLEQAAITLRGIARSLADSAGLVHDDSPVRDQDIETGWLRYWRNRRDAIVRGRRHVQRAL
jgi:hypothetical protein